MSTEKRKTTDISTLKQRAEEALEAPFGEDDSLVDFSQDDMKSHIHELQVHQIELKMQNDELRRTYEELEESRDRYSHLYDFAPNGYFTMIEKGIIDEANLTLASMLGVTRADLIGKPFHRFVLKEDQDILYKHQQRLMETGTPQSCKLRLIKKGCHELYIRLECILLKQENDFQQIRASVNDITELVQAEEKLNKSEEFNKKIIEGSHDCIKTLYPDGRLEFISKVGQALLEIEDISLYLNKSWPDFWKDSDHEAALKAISTAKEGNVGEFEGYCPTEKGKPKWWHVIITPTYKKDRSVDRLIAVSRDITEKKQKEEDQKALKEKIYRSHKMESIGTLAGGIAHDFNNILYPIIGFAEMSIQDLPENHPIKENLKVILQGAKRARDLVKQILLFSRQKELEHKPMQIQSEIEDTLKLLRAVIPANIEIQKDLNEASDFILGDPTEIHEIIMNLCTNAYHAMEETGGTLKVSLNKVKPDPKLELPPGEYCCLGVSDTGTGISPEIRDNIFEPYFTTKDLGKGSGLGLAVVYGIVKNNKGAITVESNPGKGTIFYVYLPLTSQAMEPGGMPGLDKRGIGGDERILFVDDEEPIVKLGVRILEKFGYTVTGKTSVIEALELFGSEPDKFDLVITDMAMPSMTGTEFAKKLIKIRPNIPIIICTGFSENLDHELAKTLGIMGYLHKPILINDFSSKVRKVLDQAKENKIG
ncbi:PAS domain-containing sensor histidine kinase [Desulfobacula sp.]|uniref:PAS domain-containing hybrid sensor histidine kinase/response regulator n=1 Tax=Desulfobacula sp. TaxID=2593537 RepID=UPI00262AEB75|nr:PAS domain-containing sensor histidine kinase [Desulfobacula sp.]